MSPANTAVGEIPWQTWNQPGEIQYRTNGMRKVWEDAAKKRLTRAKQRLRDAYFAREQSPAKEVRR